MEIKHWFWLAEAKTPPKMIGNMTEAEFDRRAANLKRLKEERNG